MTRVRLHLTTLVLALAASACTPAADLIAPARRSDILTPPAGVTFTPLRFLLQTVSRGLLYTSESDYPFTYFRHEGTGNAPTRALTADEFRTLVGVDGNAAIQVITLDAFFARHIERVDPFDPVGQALIPRYVLLRETLRRSLSHVKVYRVGDIAIDCYVVGFNANGDLEGLTTISIET